MKTLLLIYFLSLLLLFESCGFQAGEETEHIKKQFDILPDINQVDYSPENGSTVKVNPPPFTWMPVKKAVEYLPGFVQYSGTEFQGKVWQPVKEDYDYILQISKDKAFKSGVITRTDIDISTHALNESLEPGEWYWRYGVDHGEVVFSKPRGFTIPDDVEKRPFPNDINQVLNSVPEGHPRLFIAMAERSAFRKRTAEGDLKKTLTEIKSSLDAYFEEELPPEPDFSANTDSWWKIYNTVVPPCDRMETFGMVYLLTGDEKYGEEAKRRLLHFFAWNPEGSTSDRGHNESNYRIVNQGTRTYDWIHDLLTPHERSLIETSLKRRAEQLYHRLKYRPGSEYHVYNRGSHEERITGFLGEVAICFAGEWKEAAEWLNYVLTIHWNLYPAWAKADGAWHQGPAYWTFYQFRMLHFLTALNKATDINLMHKEFFRNTPYYILYTNPPYAKLSPFGDGQHNPPSVMRAENMYVYSSLLKDPYLRWYADYMKVSHPKNILGVILKDDDITGKPPVDLPQSRYFPGVGLISIHTAFGDPDNDIHFLFHSDPYGGVSHGHPDQNAFTLEAFGEALAIASGYYPSYGSDHHNLWSRQSMSSNTVTINNGTGQEGVAAAKGKIVRFENHDNFDYILGDATEAYMGNLTRFYRHVIHIQPGIFVIYDEIEAPQPVTFEWWLHSLSDMQVDTVSNSAIIKQGKVGLKVQFLQPGDMKFSQFAGFPYPPVIIDYKDTTMPQFTRQYIDHWHLTASNSLKQSETKFLTVLVPYKNGNVPGISFDNLVDKPGEVSFNLTININSYNVKILPEADVKVLPGKDNS